MEVYKCEACRYLFAETKLAKRCPDCGKPFVVRPATEEEQEEYHKLRIEFGYEKDIFSFPHVLRSVGIQQKTS